MKIYAKLRWSRIEKQLVIFGTKRPRVRIPALRLPEALIFLRFRVLFFPAWFPVFSGLQPARLQRGGKAAGKIADFASLEFSAWPDFATLS